MVDVGEIAGALANSLTSQQRLAVYQFLFTGRCGLMCTLGICHCVYIYTHTSEVEPFKSTHMSSLVLKRLLTQQNIVSNISFEEYKRKNQTIYSVDCPAHFFCLILEGCVEVQIGKDGMKFESRSFSYFGAQALIFAEESEYRPDFTARPLSDCLVITITQSQYAAARKASIFEGGKNTPNAGGSDGDAGGSSGSRNDALGAEWSKADSVSFGEPQKTPTGSQLGLFLTRRHDQKKQAPSARKLSDQFHLLPVGESSEPGSPVEGTSEGIAEMSVELDSEPIQSYKETPATFHQRLSHRNQVGSYSPNHSTTNQDMSYQSTV